MEKVIALADRPWLCAEAIEELEAILDADSMVFEWGAGGSTMWLAQRAKYLVCIEHSPEWHERVRDRLIEIGLDNRVGMRLSSGLGLPYVSQIDPFSSFDLIVVDGKFRVQCIERSRSHVKPGGYLVLDDSERRGYQEGVALLRGWDCKVVRGRKRGSIAGQIVATQTSFFRKAME